MVEIKIIRSLKWAVEHGMFFYCWAIECNQIEMIVLIYNENTEWDDCK